jgi:hypothetical protein
MVKVKNT